MNQLLNALIKGQTLSSHDAETVITAMISGDVRAEQIGAFLVALQFRPPSGDVLAGFVRGFRRHQTSVGVDESTANLIVDVCGTGGDGHGTFNISTTVAFVAAGAGQLVAKHGNRAVSSQCGSFDVLEALGVPFADTPAEALRSIQSYGLAFLFAPTYHPKFREFSQIRKSLGIRTVFNVLGPLLNPAGVKRQLIGVYSRDLVEPMAQALRVLGTTEAMVVCGDDGSDEISLCSATHVAHLKNGEIHSFQMNPEEFGFKIADSESLKGGDAKYNARVMLRVLEGELGPRRDVVVMNAAAALVVGGRCANLQAGIKQAQHAIDSGRALRILENMREALALGAEL
jgi:anthranilate phosphoribosyltransferase